MLRSSLRNYCSQFLSLFFYLALASSFLFSSSVRAQNVEKSGGAVWAEVEKLTNEQKFQAALDSAKSVLQKARTEKKSQLWAEALVKCTQLQMGLSGFETAVRFLKDEAWPSEPENRIILQLFYSQSLITYTQNYRWEILQREKVQAKSKLDLKTWTLEELSLEIRKSLDLAIADSASVMKPTSDFMRGYLQKGTYPDFVKPWLRSAIVDLAVSFLSDSSYWTPTQSANVYKINFKNLVVNPKKRRIPAADTTAHPIEILASWLQEQSDLLSKQALLEAALDSKYAVFERLHSLNSEASVREQLLKQLIQLQSESKKNRWWSRGQSILAQFYQEQPETSFSRMIEAMKAAEAGAREYPDSIGAKQCLHTIAVIRTGQYQLESMQTDGLGKKSIALEYKNLKKMYFRAYKIDIENALTEYKSGYILGAGPNRELQLFLKKKADFEWGQDLKETPDFLLHRSLVTAPMKAHGFYLIFASSLKDFEGGQENEVKAVGMLLSEYIVTYSTVESQKIEFQVKTGTRGRAVENAEVLLYRFDYNSSATVVSSVKTNKEGIASIAEPARDKKYWNYFFVVKKEDQYAFDLNSIYFANFGNPQEQTSSMVFTDRGVYRPEQKILFKIAGFRGAQDNYKVVSAGTPVTATLRDPNYQVVSTQQLKTNEFGTVSGEFLIPAGRPLGYWQVQSSLSGASSIRVEEYKRPTFEVTMKDAEAPLRLNKKAQIRGEAKYYFGQAVTNGKVRYRVFRSEGVTYDFMYRYFYYIRPQNLQVDQGEVSLDEKGQFVIEFNPEADEKLAKRDDRLNYNYSVQVDVTDEGGETRSSEKHYRIGFLTLEATLGFESGFQRPKKKFSIKAHLAQLDGKPRAGSASFKIFELNQPKQAQLPVEMEREQRSESPFAKGDDLERARYETEYQWSRVLAAWSAGALVQSGSFEHKASGDAEVEVNLLKNSGAYRIQYEVKDDFGKTFKRSQDFIVGDKGASQETMSLALPLILLVEKHSVEVGEKVQVYLHSGFSDQKIELEVFRGEKRMDRKVLASSEQGILEIPVTKMDRGGFTLRARILRDYQALEFTENITVPWKDKTLKVDFASFRDKVRPGSKETIRLTVKDAHGKPLKPGQAEVLAMMYDRSLDLFAFHALGDFMPLYPTRYHYNASANSLGRRSAQWVSGGFGGETVRNPNFNLYPDQLHVFSNYAIGGPGSRSFGSGGPMEMMDSIAPASPAPSMRAEKDGAVLTKSAALSVGSQAENKMDKSSESRLKEKTANLPGDLEQTKAAGNSQEPIRSNFAETAFFKPHLILGENGVLSFEYEVPDSLTSWKLMAQAMTKDLLSGGVTKEIQSVKELMVRPYLPRFLREGDQAEIKVVINNSSEKELNGQLKFDIQDSVSAKSVLALFALKKDQTTLPFSVKSKGSSSLSFKVKAPAQLGIFSFKVMAEAAGFSDGELRAIPVLPSRMHLAQSRFVALKKNSIKSVEFKEMNAGTDPSLLNEKLVVTVDAQLFYGVLQSLPSILKSPYECTEVVLDRFVTTGILSSFYESYPNLAKMAKEFSSRKTQLEKFDEADANRRMSLEESPWLLQAKGGLTEAEDMMNVLDPKVAKQEQKKAIEKLKKLQLNSGAFPWFQGGPPDEFMTVYLLLGFAKALEFKVDVPKDMVKKAWSFVASWLESELARWMSLDSGWEYVTLVNYVLGNYPDASWTHANFNAAYRMRLLDFSFKHWKDHSPLLKAYLAMTLHRMGREKDSQLVWSSVMDSAKSSEELGVYWAPEDRSWLWYNDTIETHALSLRAEMEVNKSEASSERAEGAGNKAEGLVQWLFLNKKLNQWKSTRATSEVIYSVAKYLVKNKSLAVDEEVSIDLGTQKTQMQFFADKYSGKKNQIVISGENIDSTKNSKITFSKNSPNLAFASATWHFSTEQLPVQSESDFFSVQRSYFVRENKAAKGQPPQWVLRPLASGGRVQVGDQVEVQLSLRSKHSAEYIHLRDPRAAGLEPESVISGYKWDLGLSWFEEVRDSATNFFFSALPVGEYTFKYRLRANMAGKFRLAPATLQSFYAPEFNAYSAGFILNVEAASR